MDAGGDAIGDVNVYIHVDVNRDENVDVDGYDEVGVDVGRVCGYVC